MEVWNIDDLMKLTFDSYEALEQFTKDFQHKTHQIFTTSHSTTLKYANLRGPVNEKLKYSDIRYACKLGGRDFNSRSTGERQTSSFKQGCPAFIKLHISKDRQALTVVGAELSHNHDEFSENEFKMMPEQRKLPPSIRETVKWGLSIQGNKKKLLTELKEKHGIHSTLKDFWNIQNAHKDQEDNVMKCVNMLHQNGADVELLLDHEAASSDHEQNLKALYFSTADMRRSMAAWPEIVFIDGTYKLLRAGLTVMILMVEDSNGASEIVGVGLLVQEDRATFEWFLKTFEKENRLAISRIRCFMGDKDLLERDILKSLFPRIPIYICQFHVLRALSREVANEKYNFNTENKKIILVLLEKLVKSSSDRDYAENYSKLCEFAPKTFTDYFNENWDVIKADWAQYCMVDGNLGNNTNNRLENVNSKLKQVIKKNSSLVQFVKDFFVYIESHNLQTSYKLVTLFHKKSSREIVVDECERQYMDYLTSQAFSQVLSEIEKCKYVSFVQQIVPDQPFVVQYRSNSLTVDDRTCECPTFKSHMLPCRHIFAVRRKLGLPLFQEDLCNARWTKDYYKKKQRAFDLPHDTNNGASDRRLIVTRVLPPVLTEREIIKNVTLLAKSLVSIAALSVDYRFDCKIKTLQELNRLWLGNSMVEIAAINSDAIKSIDNGHGRAKKVISVPQKRRILKPLIDILVSTVHAPGTNLEEKTNILQKIKELWTAGSDVLIHEINSANSSHHLSSTNDSELTDSIHDSNTEQMARLEVTGDACTRNTENDNVLDSNSRLVYESKLLEPIKELSLPSFPAPVRVRGRPSLSFITTVPGCKKKKISAFVDNSQLVKKETMLNWLLPRTAIKSVLENEYKIQNSDISQRIEDVRESFMHASVKLDLLRPYFEEKAYDKLKNIINSKIEIGWWTCGVCRAKLCDKNVLCECCLLKYHFQCVLLKRKPSVKITWFCPDCKKRL